MLITLGIIGVVAAMTLPTVINNAQNRELQTQLKKTYSELNQMSQLFYTEYGMSVSEFTAGDSLSPWKNFVENIFPKYFKLTMYSSDKVSGISSMPYKLYSLGNNKNVTHSICDDSGYYIDELGRLYFFNNQPTSNDENGPVICVDINGFKKPNMYGKDFFLFVFTTDGYVIPMGQEHKNNKVLSGNLWENGVNIGANFCKSGIAWATTCAYYAISDVNPQGKGTYWKDFLKSK